MHSCSPPYDALPLSRLRAPRPPKQRKPPYDARSHLIILRLGMAIAPKLRRLPQQAPSEPRPMPLPLVRHNLHLHASAPSTSTPRLASPYARIDQVLDVPLQASPEILVQRRASRKDNILVQPAAYVDG